MWVGCIGHSDLLLSDPCSTDHESLLDSLNLAPGVDDFDDDLFVDELLDDEPLGDELVGDFVDELLGDELVGDELLHDGHDDPAIEH